MRKLLPTSLFLVVFLSGLFLTPSVFAQSPTPTSVVPASTIAESIPDGVWVKDAEVTFVGKAGARAGAFLDWTLTNYKWSVGGNTGLTFAWAMIRNIVYAFFALFVLITAFIIIVTRGKNTSIMKFIPRFVLVVLLITFSFALIQFLYQVVDIVQGIFLKKPDTTLISQNDLIYIGFNYRDFVGYRLSGMINDEASFISLFLIKLTTITYYLMAGLLILRKIILWFFIFVSPIFPLLLLYAPVRNSARIWVGEFFRWLLYAPVLAVLLSGLVVLWKSPLGIPLNFVVSTSGTYPTAINILLGGPGQTISVGNSINTPQSFALYVVALIMIWVVIILPFILLQVFLNFTNNLDSSSLVKQIIASSTSFFNKPSGVNRPAPFVSKLFTRDIPPTPPSVNSPGAGMARQIPITTSAVFNKSTSNISQAPVSTAFRQAAMVSSQQFSQMTNTILKTTNLKIPTIRDIAQIETHEITNREETIRESTRVAETLQKIANPRTAVVTEQRDSYRVVRDQLITEKQKGNPVASSLLSAASVSAEGVIAGSTPSATFPVVNRVQNVSLEDYESVKKLWQENYTRLEPPKSVDGIVRDRKEWVGEDVKKVEETINKLQSNDPKMVKEGMNLVSSILPFLLVGGFSQTEIIAYLRAKLEAGKSTLSDINKKQDNEDTLLDKVEEKVEEPETLEASINPEEKPLEQSVPDSTYNKTIV